MTELTSTYYENELAWVSKDLMLTGDICLYVKLKEKGIVIIKKRNTLESENPKISISSHTDEAEYLIKGETASKILQIVTSSEPEYIKYEKI